MDRQSAMVGLISDRGESYHDDIKAVGLSANIGMVSPTCRVCIICFNSGRRRQMARLLPLGRSQRAIDKLTLPNLEDPNDLLTPERLVVGRCLDWEKQPVPQNFGWFPMWWQPLR